MRLESTLSRGLDPPGNSSVRSAGRFSTLLLHLIKLAVERAMPTAVLQIKVAPLRKKSANNWETENFWEDIGNL
jgi:hypothetical protein